MDGAGTILFSVHALLKWRSIFAVRASASVRRFAISASVGAASAGPAAATSTPQPIQNRTVGMAVTPNEISSSGRGFTTPPLPRERGDRRRGCPPSLLRGPGNGVVEPRPGDPCFYVDFPRSAFA